MNFLPPLRIPVVRTAHLRRAVAFYGRVLGFELVQEVPGAVALLRHGPLQLQLWSTAAHEPQGCCIPIDPATDCIFACHARLARRARDCITGSPVLRPWGAWEFGVTDGEGNHLVFLQWAAAMARASGLPSRRGVQ